MTDREIARALFLLQQFIGVADKIGRSDWNAATLAKLERLAGEAKLFVSQREPAEALEAGLAASGALAAATSVMDIEVRANAAARAASRGAPVARDLRELEAAADVAAARTVRK